MPTLYAFRRPHRFLERVFEKYQTVKASHINTGEEIDTACTTVL